MQMRDVIIIGAGPSGLFAALHLPQHLRVLILEKSSQAAVKLLMSAKGRGNLTNTSITPRQDYQTSDSDFVEAAFECYKVQDFLDFLAKQKIEVQEEAGSRILLKSWKVLQFRDFLIDTLRERGINILYEQELLDIIPGSSSFQVKTDKENFQSKKILLASGTKSIPKIGSTDIALQLAKKFALWYTEFYPALVGFETEKELAILSGSSLNARGELYCNKKLLYQQFWPILFTHRWISGPVVFNASLYLKNLLKNPNNQISFKIQVGQEEITKRFLSYLWFKANKLSSYTFTTNITGVRGFDEAKISGGGIKTENLTPNFELKSIPGLYVIGECLDVNWKTGGYNLQRCWTSAVVCARSFW